MSAVDVRLVTPDGVEDRPPDELELLLKDQDAGVVWVDVPEWDDEAAGLLTQHFGLHPRAVHDCAQRNPVPKVHVYPDQVFVVLHAPERGARGHVHYVELDQFIGPRHLITVHGPLNPAVAPEAAQVETRTVHRRLEAGRLQVSSSYQLSFVLVSALSARLRDYLAALTEEVWRLERAVTGGHLGDAEQFLEEMFQVRHGLLAVRTMAALSGEVYGRMATLDVFGAGPGHGWLIDLTDQFRRLRTMADGQREYLQGVIEFYQTRTNTKMTIAAERLAVIAAVTLPVTAISSVMGMNVIVNDSTKVGELAVLLTGMAIMSAALLVWARRKGWW
ncbi:magnesium transporter CorA family protein [Pseudonocardia bannensis]|uniref:Magnesium transporter CorA family protein n=1 Tax=Pseudonocardia bannensis TaxID=630973 RepID=A0A848DDF8_9PSEU|nr:magnesium transporter CorA family protein [Pseudonocardia bannensis]NMH90597.1 magnesium transporter CorA family protein [Pseudonocardia bannensis]